MKKYMVAFLALFIMQGAAVAHAKWDAKGDATL